jgi:molybdopterin converting factor small subunit
MIVNILVFGQLTDITGNGFTLTGASDTNALKNSLLEKYPELQHRTFLISVDKKISSVNTPLTDNCTVALMPPFSGG